MTTCCCCCGLDDQLRTLLRETKIFQGAYDLYNLTVNYNILHGIRQPFQQSDDEPFDLLLFDGQFTFTWDAYLEEMEIIHARRVYICHWAFYLSPLTTFSTCYLGLFQDSVAHPIALNDWILTVKTRHIDGGGPIMHIVGLEPKKDDCEKIIKALWKFGNNELKSKLCGAALEQLGLQERVEAFQFTVNLPTITANDGYAYESALDRLRKTLEENRTSIG